MDRLQSNIRTKSFALEVNESSMLYEVKRTRAVFDDSLAIPGTNRRGGWRCPPGTRYGGQITDRFGRNCGWGVSRRLANEISDLGERLENIGDRRRNRRVNRRNERVARRMQEGGRLERAARGIANALDSAETVEAPKAPRVRRGGGKIQRQRRPQFRDSELRRIEREIDQPGAPRTGDVDAPPARRPRPNAPAARRRPASQQVAREKPKPEIDAPEAPAPAKKAPVKKAAAKKKAVKKKAPAKKAPARRVTPAAGGNDEPPKMSAKPQAAAKQPAIKVGDEGLSEENLRNLVGMNAGAFDVYNEDIRAINGGIDNDMNAWREGNIQELEQMVGRQDDYVNGMKQDLQRAVDKLQADGANADEKELQRLQDVVIRANKNYAVGIHRKNALKNRLAELRGNKNPKPAGQNRYMENRKLLGAGGYRAMDFEDGANKFNNEFNDNVINRATSVEDVDKIINDIQENLTQVNDWLFKVNNIEDENNLLISFPDGDIEVADLRRNLEEMRTSLQERYSKAQQRKTQIMKKPSDAPGEDQPDWEAFARMPDGYQGISWDELNDVLGKLYGENRWANVDQRVRNVLAFGREAQEDIDNILNSPNGDREERLKGAIDVLQGRTLFYHGVLNNARQKFENEPDKDKRKALAEKIYNANENLIGFNLQIINFKRALNDLDNAPVQEKAIDILDGDQKALDDVKKRIADVVSGNRKDFVDYLEKIYGKDNAPWKDMDRAKLIDLHKKAMQQDGIAMDKLLTWAKSAYQHDLIEGRNGKKYQIDIDDIRFDMQRGNLVVAGKIYHIDANGNRTIVGNTTRSLYMNKPDPKDWFVENNYMKIDDPAHKGAGIQNVYNQHAFMYLKAAGFDKVYLGAAWDGKYVWGRVGFRDKINRSAINVWRGEINKFKDGRPSLIKNENEARRINALMSQLQGYFELPDAQKPERQPVRHMDFVYALDIPTGAGKKTRQKQLRDWFYDNMPLDSGFYYFDENGISEDPRK